MTTPPKPQAWFLLLKAPGKIWSSSGKIYIFVLSIACVVYPLYNFLIDTPLYLKRYKADQAAGKKYLPFVEGIVDSAKTRHKTHKLEDWGGDLSWMTMYFAFGAWSAILLMTAPTIKSGTERDGGGKFADSDNASSKKWCHGNAAAKTNPTINGWLRGAKLVDLSSSAADNAEDDVELLVMGREIAPMAVC